MENQEEEEDDASDRDDDLLAYGSLIELDKTHGKVLRTVMDIIPMHGDVWFSLNDRP